MASEVHVLLDQLSDSWGAVAGPTETRVWMERDAAPRRGGADDHHGLALRHLEIHVAQHRLLAERFRQAFDMENRRARLRHHSTGILLSSQRESSDSDLISP